MNYQQSQKEMKLKITKFNCEQKVFLGFLLIALVFQNIGQAAAFENELENQEVRDKKMWRIIIVEMKINLITCYFCVRHIMS